MWGLLAGLSAVFPLSTTFLKAIPLEKLDAITPALASTVATFASVFTLFVLVNVRDIVRRTRRRAIRMRSYRNFAYSLAALLAYTLIYDDYNSYHGKGPEWPILFAYVLFFVFATRAFTLLALKEYLEAVYGVEEPEHEKDPATE
jgi:uncharacterized protein with PQ loop repeat